MSTIPHQPVDLAGALKLGKLADVKLAENTLAVDASESAIARHWILCRMMQPSGFTDQWLGSKEAATTSFIFDEDRRHSLISHGPRSDQVLLFKYSGSLPACTSTAGSHGFFGKSHFAKLLGSPPPRTSFAMQYRSTCIYTKQYTAVAV